MIILVQADTLSLYNLWIVLHKLMFIHCRNSGQENWLELYIQKVKCFKIQRTKSAIYFITRITTGSDFDKFHTVDEVK
jgi:hypothetical protein